MMHSPKTLAYYFPRFDPSRLTTMREFRKMTKTALASAIGKSPSAVSQFEAGKIGLDFETFEKIISALNIAPVCLTSSEYSTVSGYEFGSCHFRAKRDISQIERVASSSYAKQIISLYNFLESKGIKFPNCKLATLPFTDYITEIQIENFACAMRKQWKLGLEPISDMAALLESLGVRIILLPDEHKSLDGFCIWVNEQPYIMVVASSPPSRLQFDYAHELAHILLHRETPPGGLDTERVANRFAGALLMPHALFIEEGPRARGGERMLLDIKKRWHVSMGAALFRARQLGMMSDSSYRWAVIQLAKSGQRTNEKGEFAKPAPTLISQAIDLINKDTDITEISDALCVDVSMLSELLRTQGVSEVSINTMNKNYCVQKTAKVLRFSDKTL